MTTQFLSPPQLFTPSDLRSRPGLVSAITTLINDAFARSKLRDPEKWGEKPEKRFTSNDSYLELLGSVGIVAVIYDSSADDAAAGEREESGLSTEGKVVAVAAAVPWRGGWLKEGAGTEDGWEIKAVAVDGGEKYLRKGLSMRLMAALEEKLVQRTREEEPAREELTLWILMAECINGVYWRKRGYREVRRATYGDGVWGCLTSFEMVVLRRDVPVRAAERAEGGLVQL
jgi:hypothetical protein